MVQDYKTLNKHTVPDNTGPPLISELIDRLHRKTLFTKFDVRTGYNNIRIKDGHQYKAAFTTPLGVFEPMVMNFGLRNAPGTFLRMMNKVFRQVQNEHPGELLVYINDVLIVLCPSSYLGDVILSCNYIPYYVYLPDRLSALTGLISDLATI